MHFRPSLGCFTGIRTSRTRDRRLLPAPIYIKKSFMNPSKKRCYPLRECRPLFPTVGVQSLLFSLLSSPVNRNIMISVLTEYPYRTSFQRKTLIAIEANTSEAYIGAMEGVRRRTVASPDSVRKSTGVPPISSHRPQILCNRYWHVGHNRTVPYSQSVPRPVKIGVRNTGKAAFGSRFHWPFASPSDFAARFPAS
jgi:hypothetical protein